MTEKQIERMRGYSLWKMITLSILLIGSMMVLTTTWNNHLKEFIVMVCWLMIILLGSINTIQEDIKLK